MKLFLVILTLLALCAVSFAREDDDGNRLSKPVPVQTPAPIIGVIGIANAQIGAERALTPEEYKEAMIKYTEDLKNYTTCWETWKRCMDSEDSNCKYTCGREPVKPLPPKTQYEIELEKYHAAKQAWDNCMAPYIEANKGHIGVRRCGVGPQPPAPPIPPVKEEENLLDPPTEKTLAEVKAKYGNPPGAGDEFHCEGGNCDKCGYAGWWGSGCSAFIANNYADAVKADDRFLVNGALSCPYTLVQEVKESCGNEIPLIIPNNFSDYRVLSCDDNNGSNCQWLIPKYLNGSLQVVANPEKYICNLVDNQPGKGDNCILPGKAKPAGKVKPRK